MQAAITSYLRTSLSCVYDSGRGEGNHHTIQNQQHARTTGERLARLVDLVSTTSSISDRGSFDTLVTVLRSS